MMIEDAQHKAMQTPGHKYNPDILKYRPRSACARIASKPRVSGTRFNDTRMKSIVKDKSRPDMGSYQVTESHDKTRQHKRHFSFSKYKRTTYLDEHLNKKKDVPGIGKYVIDVIDKKLSKGPTSQQRKR